MPKKQTGLARKKGAKLASNTAANTRKGLWQHVSKPINSVTSNVTTPLYSALSSSLDRIPKRMPTFPALHRTHSTTRYLRRRYGLTKPNVAAVFNHKKPGWMKQALRWDLVGVSLSKFWGTLNSRPLPVWARRHVYNMWGRVFRCNMNEVKEPLETYPTLAAFFARELKEGARPIATDGMASPVDGRVLSFGEAQSDMIEQIKGKQYSLATFLGSRLEECLLKKKENVETKMHYCIIYLSPGDYHRIHFPVDCTINKRLHFPGTLFPVNYPFLRMIPSLFALNERVVTMGEWDQGFFSLTAVGAYNVGSIELKFDDTLKTNQISRDYTCANLEYFSWNGMGTHAYKRDFTEENGPIEGKAGAEFGQFHFGSTVVIVFEAENFKWDIEPGQHVKMGEKIGECM